MAEPLTTPETASIADGATASFATSWPFEYAAEVRVTVDGGLMVEGVDYDLSGGDWLIGGANVVFRAGRLPAAGARVARRRVTLAQQLEPFGDLEQFRPSLSEKAYDRLTRAVQDRQAETGRALAVPVGEPGVELPPAPARRGRVLGFADSEAAGPLAVPNDAVAVADDLERAEAARAGAEGAAESVAEALPVVQAASGAATAARDAAQNAAQQAAAYLDAFDAEDVYDSEAAGRAAVADGVHFWERTADGLKSWRRVDASSSVEGPVLPSLVQVAAATEAVTPRIIMARQTNASANYLQVEALTPMPATDHDQVRFRMTMAQGRPAELGMIIELAGFGEAFQLRARPGGPADQVPDGMWEAGDEIEWAFVPYDMSAEPKANYWLLTDVIRAPAVPAPPQPEGGSEAAFWAAANSRIFAQRSFGK